MQYGNAEAVKTEVAAALDQPHVVAEVVRPAAVADDDTVRGHAGFGEYALLLVAQHAGVGVGGYGRAGLDRRCGRGQQQHVLVLAYGRLPGGHLDDARAHAGVAYALGQLLDVHLGDVVGAATQLGAKLPVGTAALVFLVQARGADDVKPGPAGYFCHQAHVAPEIVGAGVEHAVDAVRLHLLYLVHAHVQALGVVHGLVEGVGLGAGVGHEQVLVHQRAAEIVYVDRPGDGLYCCLRGGLLAVAHCCLPPAMLRQQPV